MIREVDMIHTNPFARKIEYVLDDKSIGYLEYSLIYDRMEIDNFKVIDEYRNKGIGTKLLAHLISLAISYRVINITLEVRVSNEIAINLYKKFGFREVALRKYYYGDEDGILMEKQVM
jgi:ribosomal-protein-alanine N-acetyltransferase